VTSPFSSACACWLFSGTEDHLQGGLWRSFHSASVACVVPNVLLLALLANISFLFHDVTKCICASILQYTCSVHGNVRALVYQEYTCSLTGGRRDIKIWCLNCTCPNHLSRRIIHLFFAEGIVKRTILEIATHCVICTLHSWPAAASIMHAQWRQCTIRPVPALWTTSRVSRCSTRYWGALLYQSRAQQRPEIVMSVKENLRDLILYRPKVPTGVQNQDRPKEHLHTILYLKVYSTVQ